MIDDILRTKRDGHPLSEAHIRAFIAGYTDGSIPDYQASALLMAIVLNGMDGDELAAWTDAMLRSGDVLDLSDIDGVKVDKHSTGGVGDKVSLILAPLVAEAGVPVPMISGRGLGHTGGTLDKLESIPGFRTDLSVARFRELVATLGVGLIGQTAEIAPADKKLYALRDVTATVECIPLIASSIMSKKLAEGIDGLVLDVKTGSGAFMATRDDARTLAETMVDIGARAGKHVCALITDMGQPLGVTVGNALEVRECCDVLRGEGPPDLRALTVALSAEMLVIGGVATSLDDAEAALERILDSGAAFERFGRIVEAQGGDRRALDDPALLPSAQHTHEVRAARDGFVHAFACADVGRAAGALGAGRQRKEDAIRPGVGLEVLKKRGDAVVAGEPLFRVHHDGVGLERAVDLLQRAVELADTAPAAVPLVMERIDSADA